MPARVLIVRLSALGDVVHAVPVLQALTRQDPAVTVDWLVEGAYAPVLSLVSGLRRRVVVRAAIDRASSEENGRRGTQAATLSDAAVFPRGTAGTAAAVRFLRRQRYDLALDLQGLIKSAVWARLSGARRVIGFAPDHLRERPAAWFYDETVTPPHPAHVIDKNLAVAAHLGAARTSSEVELVPDTSASVAAVIAESGRYAVLNPGAGWPNKRWPAERFSAVANALWQHYGLRSLVTWGPGEHELASAIVAGAPAVARLSPPTRVGELAALMQGAALVVSGDTGPLHIAAAVNAPIVGLYGPTWPERNGPWNPADEVISRADQCQCHHKRRCLLGNPCIETIGIDEVIAAAGRRLGTASA